MAAHGNERVRSRRPLGEQRPGDQLRAEGAFEFAHPEHPSDIPPLRSLDALPNNLPVQPSSFIGRRRELADVGRLLTDERLVALTGAGGSGKTRLALQAASEALERFPDGAWWVELAPLAEERLVGATIAEALGVRPLPGMTALDACGAFLASRRALIVLDNCEHLLEACAAAAEALAGAAPEVVVLATSRAPLGVSGEAEWRVPSLSLPGKSREEAKAPGASDAVALFLERAADASSDLAMGPDDAASVAAICTELDGMPLAIELAAARVRILSVAQIADELSDRFRLLSGGPQSATPRLKTMRASVEWSYELLSDQERALLRRLAVFAGGLALEAVDEVCTGDGIEHEAVLDLIASLVDQSLVIADERERRGVRYRLLETVRQFGLERLAEAGEEETIRDRHRDHFLALAEEAGPHLDTGRQREWLEILDPEAANLAAAIEYALRSQPPFALRFSTALCRWWCARGRFAEAELAYSRSLDTCGDCETALRARAFQRRAWVATNAGESEAAATHAVEALALAEEAGDEVTAVRARCELGITQVWGTPREARAELSRAADLSRAAGDDWALVTAKQMLAASYVFQSDHAQATRANDEVGALAERIGDPFQVGRRWLWSNFIAYHDGRLAEARDAIKRQRAAVEAAGEPVLEAAADQCLALVDIYQGDSERPLERLNQRLEQSLKLGAGLAVGWLTVAIAIAELSSGRLEEAREHLESLVALLEGQEGYVTSWALCLLADARRLLDDAAAEPAALEAQASAERLGNRLFETRARLTLGRLAATRGDWATAQQHVLAHLDACVEGGHATYVPSCLDALAEVAAGLEANEDAVRLLAAAERARDEIGIVRVPPEEDHWAAIERQLREALGDDAYEAARAQGAELSIDDALEWARRARGPRKRPPGGWASLTPTELKVAELVADGLTNPQIAERMFISKATVKTHLAHIFKKLEVHNRAELSAQAAQRKHEQLTPPRAP